MNNKEINKQIKNYEKKIKELKLQLEEDFIKIPELKIKIQKSIHHKNKSYNDLVEEYGEEYLEKHLPTYVQLQWLRNSKYCKELNLIDPWEFIKQEDLISKKNGFVAGFVANSFGASLYCNGDRSYSDDSLGVRCVL